MSIQIIQMSNELLQTKITAINDFTNLINNLFENDKISNCCQPFFKSVLDVNTDLKVLCLTKMKQSNSTDELENKLIKKINDKLNIMREQIKKDDGDFNVKMEIFSSLFDTLMMLILSPKKK